MKEQKKDTPQFKDTLNLPKTEFPIRPNTKVDDAAMIEKWRALNIYTKTFYANQGNKKFILHDGPPYANGHIHLGSGYNKILKDINAKAHRMMGLHVPITPGWDCHGLPIEHKVVKEKPGLDRVSLKKACRDYAAEWINVQRREFQELGVLMDWDRPYTTMQPAYEGSILEVLATLCKKGFIERKNKTVAWCYHCQTVLAAAEIEYAQRKDPSIYVLFKVKEDVAKKLYPLHATRDIHAVVWTTTPWTLPLNRAVAINPDTNYVLLDINGQHIITAQERADFICSLIGAEKHILATCSAHDFIKNEAQLHHPIKEDRFVPVVADQSVELSEGTAFVHIAPGAGPIDYEIGLKHGLEIFSPVDSAGRYTNQIEPSEWTGLVIDEAQGKVINFLVQQNRLFHKTTISHSYPHCWRCRNGLIFRATKQWFCNLEKNNLKEESLKAIDTIAHFPEKSANHFKATIGSRLEWCISRQRVWGVPIPALLCKDCNGEYISPDLILMVAKNIAEMGIEWWDQVSVAEIAKDFFCATCNGTSWQKEQDILDVWFDAGSSFYAVLQKNKELTFPANLYLEGRDQHRGWFQSSLLLSMIANDTPPMKAILTHGYTVDKQGRKMSKSLGNVVTPGEVIEKIGVDGLRLWVASVDCSGGDIVMSDVILQNIQESLRKIRNTCRFLLSNLYDFDITKDAITLKSLRVFDRRALEKFALLQNAVIDAYKEFGTAQVFHALVDYCTNTLSATYLDIIKDRLYVEKADGHARRSAQTVCWYILDGLVRLIAPIMSITAEQIAQLYQREEFDSIHLQCFSDLSGIIVDHSQEKMWEELSLLRSAILKAIEQVRETGLIKHSLEAKVRIFISPESSLVESIKKLQDLLNAHDQSYESFMKEYLIVSQFELLLIDTDLQESDLLKKVYIAVEHAQGNKCPRCWQWEENNNLDHLCNRCLTIVR